jgi:DNA-binding phage protein
MVLTVNFRDSVKARIEADPEYRAALFKEAVQTQIGFAALAKATRIPPKSLMRMFGPNGNPTAANLSEVIRVLQKKTGVHLEVRASAA